MKSSVESDQDLINRREAIRRVSALLGGMAFVGGSGLLAAAETARPAAGATVGEFSVQDIVFLDEIAETILPATKTPGAKAAKTGAFMALMVTDCYSPAQQKVFRDGMRKLDDAAKKANGASFMAATSQQRLAVLTVLDREQKRVMDAREAADRKRKGLAPLRGVVAAIDEGNAASSAQGSAQGTEPGTEPPAHYFRMMKELALLGYFTSEIGCKQAMRYVEAPGRFDACVPYTAGDPAWAQHA
jgi:Gluconate 2-dehydrogenase subunit 3